MEFNFEREVLRVLPSLKGQARKYANKYHDEDDLLQQTAMKALENRESFTPGTNLRAWLGTILYHYHVGMMRKRSRREAELDNDPYRAESIPVAATAQIKVELTEAFWAMNDMPEDMLEAFKLVTIEDMSYEEVAEKLGVAIGTVKSRVSRGRKVLRTAMGLSGGEIDDATDYY